MTINDNIIDDDIDILNFLLKDQTSKSNIIWATDNYKHLGADYYPSSEIIPSLISNKNTSLILSRFRKEKHLQTSRSKDMAEVYTPAWVCNKQNNLVDSSWFGKANIFNKEIMNEYGKSSWKTIKRKIVFPTDKNWQDYVSSTRLEICCGEAPYLTSRYDATNGEYIEVHNRIGLLDRKLRVVTENNKAETDWVNWAIMAYKSIYGYEFHGDSLYLARKALLTTFIENFSFKFRKLPDTKLICDIAYILSWNIWQMNGLSGTIPYSCDKERDAYDLLGYLDSTVEECKGCKLSDIKLHRGTYCKIMNWNKKGLRGRQKMFVDLLS